MGDKATLVGAGPTRVIDAAVRFARRGMGDAGRQADRVDRGPLATGVVVPFLRRATQADVEGLVAVVAAPASPERARLLRHVEALRELNYRPVAVDPGALMRRDPAALQALRGCGLAFVASPSVRLMEALEGAAAGIRVIASLPDRKPHGTCDRALALALAGRRAGPLRVGLARSLALAEAWRALGLAVRVVPDTVVPVARRSGLSGRSGVVFLGGQDAAADAEAARVLVSAVMPLVWAEMPGLPCLLAAPLPARARRELIGPGVAVAARADALRQGLVVVVPHAGKAEEAVLAAMAERLPCAATAAAGSGLGLSSVLRGLLAADDAGLAALVPQFHRLERLTQGAVRAAGAMLRRDHAPAVAVDVFESLVGRRAGIRATGS